MDILRKVTPVWNKDSDDVGEGRVETATEHQLHAVDANFAANGDECAVKREPNSSLIIGDSVRILEDVDKLKLALKEHWTDDMTNLIGLVGKITHIYTDGYIDVDFGSKSYMFPTTCCENVKVQQQRTDAMTKNAPSTSIRRDTTDHPAADRSAFIERSAHALRHVLDHLQTLYPSISDVPPCLLYRAAAENKPELAFIYAIAFRHLIDAKCDGFTPLMIASQLGHTDVVEGLLHVGADINIKSDTGTTALILALVKGHGQIAYWLLQNGADVDQKYMDRSPMHFAAYRSDSAIIKELIKRNADPNVQDIDGDTPLHVCILGQNIVSSSDLVKYRRVNLLLKNKHKQTPMILAAVKNAVTTIEHIFDRVPINKNASIINGAIQAAVYNGHTDVVRLLIKAGVDVNDLNDNCKDSGQYPSSALHFACYSGNFKISKLLVEAGARINRTDRTEVTPLHLCVCPRSDAGIKSETEEILRLNKTPERIQERTDLACFLVKHGAQVLIKDGSGNSPLDECIDVNIKAAIIRTVKLYHSKGKQGINWYDTLFSRMPVPCVKCMNLLSEIRLIPCGHVVLCRPCASKFHDCPRCNRDIEQRLSLERFVVDDFIYKLHYCIIEPVTNAEGTRVFRNGDRRYNKKGNLEGENGQS
ncbi:hypothetical protein DPMN_190144 [Dreissena polymorpha]|uniref:RING-type E3 ubiquitin transferase n=1 Tax=Dreissena polymorpha TaxID=45954 RepID=A0A9D4DUU2_DREPO|nr:hypothetical protein DPMN_190144 [Dreissena polymorpha]